MARSSWGFAFLAVVNVVSASLSPSHNYFSSDDESCLKRRHGLDIPWIVPLVIQEMIDYIPSGKDVESQCTKDGQIYATHLRNLTYWATKMYDASSYGSVSGILEGQNFNYGHFDECVSTKSARHGITGKYVIAKLEFAPCKELHSHFYEMTKEWKEPDSEDSAWAAIKLTNDWRISQRNALHWGLCVPSSCEDSDIEASLQNQLYPSIRRRNFSGNLTILSKHSYSKTSEHHVKGLPFYFFLAAGLLIVVLVVYSTFYDVLAEEAKEEQKPWFTDFSLRKNYLCLIEQSDNEFLGISGMKVLSMISSICGHRMLFAITIPQFHTKDIQLTPGKFIATAFINGSVVVNTFLVISGFLTFYKITEDVNKNRNINAFRKICHRWLRLTPAYIAVLVIHYYLGGGGPLGEAVLWSIKDISQCWWTHLLYINNYIKSNFQAFIPSWYLAVDLQMYIFSYCAGALLQRKWSLTPYALSLLAVLSLLPPVLVTLKNRYYGTLIIQYKLFYKYITDPMMMDAYIPTHLRSTPYVIGMLGGYIYYYAKKRNMTIRPRNYYIWCTINILILFLCFKLAFVFHKPEREYIIQENISYVVLHRILWSTAICWMIFATAFVRKGGIMEWLGLRVYEPLNKLNYSVFLVHSVIQTWLIGYIRAPDNYGWVMGLWMGCGDAVFSYAAAFIIYLFIEAPFLNLQRRLPF